MKQSPVPFASSEFASCERVWLQTIRYRFRFGIRSLLIVVTVLAAVFAWVSMKVQELQQEQAAAAWVRAMGGYVNGEEGGVLWNGEEVSWYRAVIATWGFDPVLRVNLSNTQVRDISRLAACEDLEWLILGDTNVSDLSAIENFKSLRGLWISDTKVASLAPLAKLKALERLYLSDTYVTDLSPLADLRSLENLWLGNTCISNLSPLTKLVNLQTIYIGGTKADEEQVRLLSAALPNCGIMGAGPAT